MLKDFELSKIDNFNLTKILRLQYLTENLLQYEASEDTLQKYTGFLMQMHKMVIQNIASHHRNFELIVKNLRRGNYVYLELLSELLETLKFDLTVYGTMQQKMYRAGLFEWMMYVLKEFEFKREGSTLSLRCSDLYFNKIDNLYSFLQVVLNYLSLNPNCYFSKLFPINEAEERIKMLKVFFGIYLQDTFVSIKYVAFQILETILKNTKRVTNRELHEELYIRSFIEFTKEFETNSDIRTLKVIEMLNSMNSHDMAIKSIESLQLTPLLVSKINSTHSKKLVCHILKVLSIASPNNPLPLDCSQTEALFNQTKSLKHLCRNNMLASHANSLFKSTTAEERS